MNLVQTHVAHDDAHADAGGDANATPDVNTDAKSDTIYRLRLNLS